MQQPSITLPVLLRKAGKFCIHIGASQEARKAWKQDIDNTPQHLYADLYDYFDWAIENMPAAKREISQLAEKVDSCSPATTAWIDADKASQQHYWNCPQCKTVELQKIGSRCAEGQKLHDAYIEAAANAGRLKTSSHVKKPSNSGVDWSIHAEWRKAYQAYYSHYCQCSLCKAAGRGNSGRCTEGEKLYEIYQEAENKNH